MLISIQASLIALRSTFTASLFIPLSYNVAFRQQTHLSNSHGIPSHPFIINRLICIMCLQNEENRFAIQRRNLTIEDIIHSNQEAAAKKELSFTCQGQVSLDFTAIS